MATVGRKYTRGKWSECPGKASPFAVETRNKGVSAGELRSDSQVDYVRSRKSACFRLNLRLDRIKDRLTG